MVYVGGGGVVILSSTHFWSYALALRGFHKLLNLYNNIWTRRRGGMWLNSGALIDRRNICVYISVYEFRNWTGDDVNVGTLGAKLPIFWLKIYLNLTLSAAIHSLKRLSGILVGVERLRGSVEHLVSIRSQLGDTHLQHGKWFWWVMLFLAWVKVAHATDSPLIDS